MNITNSIISHPRKFSLIISIVICLFFLSSTPSINVGYGDSDEFLTVGHSWGLAHPPGYSFYVTILHLASITPIPNTTEAFRMHAVSGVSAATAIYITLILLFEIDITKFLGKRRYNKSLKLIAISITSIAMATAKLYWLYAQIAEKYIFSAPFVAYLFLLGYRLLYRHHHKYKTLTYFGLTYGLLLSHHQSMIFLLPYILYVIWKGNLVSKKINIAYLTIFPMVGYLLPLSLTLIQQYRQIQPSWYLEPGLTGLFNFITRKDFVGMLYKTGTPTSGYIPSQITLSQIVNGTLNYFKIFFESTFWWTSLPLLLSGVTLLKKNKHNLVFFSLPPILLGIALASFLNWPTDIGSQAATIRFFIPSLITWSPLLYIGIYEILYRLYRFMVILGLKKNYSINIITLLILPPIILAITQYPKISLKNFDLVSRVYSKVLTDVKPNSLVTCYSDSSCFALLYEQTVNHLRPDVDIVPLVFPLVKNTIEAKKLAGFTYTENPYLIMDIVTWNIGLRPVYAVDISQYYFNFFGFDSGFLTYTPTDYAAEINREIPLTFVPTDYQISLDYVHQQIPSFDLMRRYLVQSISQIHLTNAYVWLRTGDRPKAQTELSIAVNLSYRLTDWEKNLSQAYRSQIERTLANATYSPGNKSVTSTRLISYLPDLFKQNYNSRAFAIARGAVMANPRDVQARIELARIFQLMGDHVFMKREYQHVLILDPQNQEANQILNNIFP